jgi:hypothetical protein
MWPMARTLCEMTRARRLAGPAVLLAALSLAACSAPSAPTVVGPKGAQRDDLLPVGNPGDVPAAPGVLLIGLTHPPALVFGSQENGLSVQPATTRLVAMIATGPRISVRPLLSPADTAALSIQERATTRSRWGELSTPAQRTVYEAFARDRGLGRWLVVVTDVRVAGGTDPIPMIAYRWPRTAVEAYLSCGIPAVGVGIPWTGIDECTQRFFADADEVVLRADSGAVGSKQRTTSRLHG